VKYKIEIERIMDDRNDKQCIKILIAGMAQDTIFSI
jgi:hypothetical protein